MVSLPPFTLKLIQLSHLLVLAELSVINQKSFYAHFLLIFQIVSVFIAIKADARSKEARPRTQYLSQWRGYRSASAQILVQFDMVNTKQEEEH